MRLDINSIKEGLLDVGVTVVITDAFDYDMQNLRGMYGDPDASTLDIGIKYFSELINKPVIIFWENTYTIIKIDN